MNIYTPQKCSCIGFFMFLVKSRFVEVCDANENKKVLLSPKGSQTTFSSTNYLKEPKFVKRFILRRMFIAVFGQFGHFCRNENQQSSASKDFDILIPSVMIN